MNWHTTLGPYRPIRFVTNECIWFLGAWSPESLHPFFSLWTLLAPPQPHARAYCPRNQPLQTLQDSFGIWSNLQGGGCELHHRNDMGSPFLFTDRKSALPLGLIETEQPQDLTSSTEAPGGSSMVYNGDPNQQRLVVVYSLARD